MKIFITGDSRGLGREMCERLSKKHEVVGLSRSKIKSSKWKHIVFDMLRDDPLKLKNELKNVDVLIHNAAVANSSLILVGNSDLSKNIFEINYFKPVEITKIWMKQRLLLKKPGNVIFVSSICTKKIFKGLSDYACSKSAINTFSKTIAKEMGKRGIVSNCILPGYMSTEMSSGLGEDNINRIRNQTPVKTLTEPGSVAIFVESMISNNLLCINGSEIIVDGGYTI